MPCRHDLLQSGIEDRPSDLNALIHIARHEVGARKIDLHIFSYAEAIDATVLEQASNDRNDLDVLGVTLDSWHDTGDTAYEKRGVNARL